MNLNLAEKLILRAMLTRSYYGKTAVSRPSASHMANIWELGTRQHLILFTDFDHDMTRPLEWALSVINALCENRIPIPRSIPKFHTWGEANIWLRNIVTVKFEADQADAQEELDDPLGRVLLDTVIKDGTVQDPWGASLSKPTFWLLDNLTLNGIFTIYLAVNNAAQDALFEGLLPFTLDPSEGPDPRKAAHEAFQEGMRFLREDLEDELGLR